MLIIPFHRKPTYATFPWVTLLLVLVNVFVYVALQRPDDARHARAVEAYAQSRLAEIEVPAYRAYVMDTPTILWRERWLQMPAEYQDQVLAMQLNSDEAFLAELRAGKWLTADSAQQVEWQLLRAQLDATWKPSFTERHLLRQSEVAPSRMFSAMFLHGDATHLIGNMVFLVLLGLVVEPVLGAAGFLMLYLLAGMGGALFSLGWRWGEVGAALGASGAIAGLMGAFAVLWGRRRVRLFYWVFFVFDYTRVRALWLLPVWFGWEFAQLLLVQGSNVGFDAHAGGILSGAGLAWLAVRTGRVNLAYLDEEEHRDRRVDELAAGLQALGQLRLDQARATFDALIQRHPDDPDVLEPWLRSWLFLSDRVQASAAVEHALSWRARSRVDALRQCRWFEEAAKAFGTRLPAKPETLIALVARWQAPGLLKESSAVLARIEQVVPHHPQLAAAWFRLALAHQERREETATRQVLSHLRAKHPDSPEAGKARTLLG
jgi:membrane associated rhomboid family serine protease